MTEDSISEKIFKSGYFDADWYLEKYGESEGFENNPLGHFESIGIYKGLDPSPRFDSHFYLRIHSDVSDSKMPPFLHYLLHGLREKRATVRVESLSTWIEDIAPEKISRSLDLGCGASPQNPFKATETFGIDIREDLDANIRKADLAVEAIPFADEFFGAVTAYDFIEHIPRIIYAPARRFSFVELMNEIYRVLKPGGLFLSHTPAYPAAAAFRDPTHVNIITEETFPMYFDDTVRTARMYGFKGSFKIEYQKWAGNKIHLQTVLRKVSFI